MASTTKAAEPEESSMSLMAHLRELRSRIFKCAAAVVIGAVLGWFLFELLFDFLIRPMKTVCETQACLDSAQEGRVINYDPLDPLVTRVKLAMYVGVGVAMPVLLYQLWKFVAPGLYQNEKKYTLAFIGPALLLFVAGAALAYSALPVSLTWLQSIGGGRFEVAYTADKFITLVGWMMLAFGVAFQFPVVLVALMLIKVVTVSTLAKQWRYFIAGIAVVTAVITPTGDPFTFMLLAIPMSGLYGLSLLIGLLVERARRLR